MTDYSTGGVSPARVVATAEAAGSRSAVSWAAIIAGGVGSAAVSLMLLTAGAGLGLTSISPWSNEGVSATALGISAVLWLALIQILAMGFGGYLAGRLRTRADGLTTGESGFRDSAHGFLVWALGSIIGAVFLASTASAVISGAARIGASAASGVGSAVSGVAGRAADQVAQRTSAGDLTSFDPSAYLTDTLLRRERPEPTSGDTTATRAEVARIVATSLRNGDMTAADRSYVAGVVAAQTGLNQADAEKRVNDTITQAKATAAKAEEAARSAADQARRAGAQFALASFIAMLIGALAASLGASMGGRARDRIAA